MNKPVRHSENKKPLSIVGMLIVMAMVLSACAANNTPTQTTSSPGISATQAGGNAPTIDVSNDPTYGNILVDGNGMTLYVFTVDGPDQSNCDASCIAIWPPFVTTGTPKLGPGVDASLVNTATLSDGRKIVTYDHMPLYYYVQDIQPGQTNGEDVGSVWFVISPGGKPVKAPISSEPIASTQEVGNVASINVASDTNLGQYLVDGQGLTLYVFTKDGPDQSNCNTSCLANWPPLISEGNPILGPGVDDSKIGLTSLGDGRLIVTYDHMPLYYYAGDSNPGDVNGQGVGGVWYVINPDGAIIMN
jgi:predicted lipoprotein with Yx(FWY)xxD motif